VIVYTMQVGRSRRRAWLMLAMTVLWIAMPVSACLRAMQPMGQHACCHGMAQACESPEMNASGSCCLVHRQNVALAPVYPDAVDHSQTLAVVSHPAGLPVPHTVSARSELFLTPPPSLLSSPGASILRI
jgi:hypothetical protein